MRNVINHKPVTAHLFEYTTSFAIDPNLHFKYPNKGIVPTQIIFCMKERNQKKINSHRWFFNAFGSLLQVRFSVERLPKERALRNVGSQTYAC
jgi:chitin synthase